ncbi:TetR family transcriptional regulator [Geomonas sp. Red276]
MRLKTEAKRQAIIEEAAELFRAVGFERASMAEICARVGGSKATVYNYFSSKEELFIEVVMQSTEAQFEAVHQSFEEEVEDVSLALRRFGERFLALIYSPEILATRHMAIAQAKHSEAGRLIYERGVLRSQKLIANFLESCMKKGKLRQADPMIATLHLVSLLEAEFRDRFLFQLPGDITAEEIAAGTARAVEVFIAAYAPQQPKPGA